MFPTQHEERRQISLALTPAKFWKLIAIMEKVRDKPVASSVNDMLFNLTKAIDGQTESLVKADADMAQEIRRTMRQKRRAFEDPEEHEEMMRRLAEQYSNDTFIGVVLNILEGMRAAADQIFDVTLDMQYMDLTLPSPDKRPSVDDFSIETMRDYGMLIQLNGSTIRRFVHAVEKIESIYNYVVAGAQTSARALEHYYERLLKRHSIDGIQIHHNPVTTDIAIAVYENIDAHGEIADGKNPDELSAYSMRKATILAEIVKSQAAQQFIREPDDFINVVINHFNTLWSIAQMLRTSYGSVIEDMKHLDDSWSKRKVRVKTDTDFVKELEMLRDLNPNAVTYKEKVGLLSAEERFLLKFRNETLGHVARRLINKEATSASLVEYVLKRKAELHKYFTEENSFYVCKIGAGNHFSGEAPGQLKVVPGTKPSVILDEIVGSGFDEIRDFISQVETSGKWHDLFVATSPSRTADKSNVLLIGPQGCGKTEAMRAVGADKKSVAIFAQGSDFFTCWMGEADKNPKRLFQEAVRIQREANRHVYILIDEIDQVLHNDHSTTGRFNLTREFQILMDGVVSYPSLSVWGATNHPERIPMPMIRRFSKALIVGELDIENRVKLLKHYAGFLPTRDFDEGVWRKLALRLEGATGDIVRKIVDPIWRSKMRNFTESSPKEAKVLMDWLNRNEKFDVRTFNEGERKEFHGMLSSHVYIEPEDLELSIEDALHNLAILNEIRVAQETYANAHKLVSDLREQQGVSG